MKIIKSDLEDGRVPFDVLVEKLHLSRDASGEIFQRADLLQSFHAALAYVEKKIGFGALIQTYFVSHVLETRCAITLDIYDARLLDIAVDGLVLNEGAYVVKKTQNRFVIEAGLFVEGALVELTVQSGYAELWSNVPPELRAAILDITAAFFEKDDEETALKPVTLSVLSSYALPRLSLRANP